jgi:hypothetical protein
MGFKAGQDFHLPGYGEAESRVFGIIGENENAFAEFALATLSIDLDLNFSFPARGNRCRGDDGCGATSASLGSFDVKYSLALVFDDKNMLHRFPLRDFSEVVFGLIACHNRRRFLGRAALLFVGL